MPLDPERAERASDAYDLRRAGRGYRYIAEALDCSVSTAHDLVQYAIKARMPQAAEEERQLEVDRYDSWLARLEEKLVQGADPVQVVPVLLKLSERRARLVGLDAPKRVNVRDERPEGPATASEFADAVRFAEREARVDEDGIYRGDDEEGVTA